jgi:hypothetical protein
MIRIFARSGSPTHVQAIALLRLDQQSAGQDHEIASGTVLTLCDRWRDVFRQTPPAVLVGFGFT